MKLFTLLLVFMAVITCSMAVIINGRQVNRKPNLHYTPLAKRNGTITLRNSTFNQRDSQAIPRRRLVRRRDCNKGNNTPSNKSTSDNGSTDNSNSSDSNSSTNDSNGNASKKIVNLAAKVDTEESSKEDDNSSSDAYDETNNNDNNNDNEQTTSKDKNKSKSSSSSKNENSSSSKDKNTSSSSSSEGEFSGKITFYTPDNGACENGDYGEDDMVAALNAPQYGDTSEVSQYCGKCASVTGNKGTVVVKIIDACEDCPEGNLDASKGAFDKITSSDGVGEITWSWVDC